MYKFKTMQPLMQAMSIIAVIMIVISGVTFAALQSQQATVKGNSIVTAMADLKLSKNNQNYTNSLDGYSFTGLIPGGAATPTDGYPIYLLNGGSTALALKLSVDSSLSNPDMVNLAKVHIILSPFGGGALQNITLQDLMTANTTGGIALTGGAAAHLLAGTNTGFTMQIMMEGDAVSGAIANIGNITFNFNATAVN